MNIVNETIMYVLISIGCIAAFVGFMLLVITNYHAVLYLNIILLSVAFFEPSPSDIIFVFLALFIWRNGRLDTSILNKSAYLISPLYLYIMINMLSLFNLAGFRSAIVYLAITIYLIFYALFISGSSFMTGHVKTFHAYVISSTLAALLGIAGYIFRIPMLAVYEYTRAKAMFKDPNVFGPFLVPAIIILFSILRTRTDKKSGSWLYLFAILINFTGLVLSFSRGAYVNFVIALMVYIILNRKEICLRRFIPYLMIIVLIAGTVWFGALDKDFKSFLTGRLKLQDYDSQRFIAQRSGLEYAGERIFGYGPGQYETMVEKIMGKGLSAHSLYMRILLENGIAGFAVMMVFLILLILNIYRECMRCRGQDRENGFILLSILCGILVNSLVVDTLHWRHFWLFIGLGLGLISNMRLHFESQQQEGEI